MQTLIQILFFAQFLIHCVGHHTLVTKNTALYRGEGLYFDFLLSTRHFFFFFFFTWVDWLFSQVHLRYTYPSSKQMGPSLDKSNWSLGLKKELPFFTLQNNKFVNFARPLISNTTWPNRLGTLLFCIYSLF